MKFGYIYSMILGIKVESRVICHCQKGKKNLQKLCLMNGHGRKLSFVQHLSGKRRFVESWCSTTLKPKLQSKNHLDGLLDAACFLSVVLEKAIVIRMQIVRQVLNAGRETTLTFQILGFMGTPLMAMMLTLMMTTVTILNLTQKTSTNL